MWLAIAIVLVTILYLVDKNRVWGTFWKILVRSSAAAVILAAVGFGYLQYADHKTADRSACAAKVRAAFPGAYDDLPDLELAEKVIAKYPTCAIPEPSHGPWERYSDLPKGAKDQVPEEPAAAARKKADITLGLQSPDK